MSLLLPPHAKPTSWTLGLLLTMSVLSGCDGSSGGRDNPISPSAATHVTPRDGEGQLDGKAETQPADGADFEALRALGYVELAQPLPANAKTGVLLHRRERARAGLNMFTNSFFCSTQLMDMNGEVHHAWSHEPSLQWANTVLSPEGDLLIVGRLPYQNNQASARASRYLMRMNWDGDVLWKKDLAAHHDVEVNPAGQVLTLTYDLVQLDEVHPDIPLRDNALVLLSADGDVLEELPLSKLLRSAPELFQIQAVPEREFEGGWEIDLFHANAVEWMRQPELIAHHPLYDENTVLLCVRNQNAVVLMDWSTKRLLWAWGQGEVLAPHDANVLPNGNILIFDNRLGRDWSRVVEVDPLTREIVWEFRAPDPTAFYSATRGANQRLSNGHTLITDSDSGRVFEIDANKRVVWDFLNPNITEKREPSVIMRMRRFEGVEYADFAQGIRSGRGLPFFVD